MASTEVKDAGTAAEEAKSLPIRESASEGKKGSEGGGGGGETAGEKSGSSSWENQVGTSLDQQAKLAELEKLSSEYQPTYTSAYIGNLQSSKALQSEYAQADPAFVRKTTALAPKYSCYRVVRGDGNCAWRALAFGYFELLLRSNDPKRIPAEVSRLQGLNSLLNKAGYSEYLYEDFADASFEVLNSLESQVAESKGEEGQQKNDSILVSAFNDQGTSDAVITHFKFLTSAWMKTNQDNYQPFLPDQTVDEYCSKHVEPYGVEAEHVGINALIDCIFLPANLSVEILYLDRSPGDEVNVHQFGKPDNEKSILRLLYRPGHYDILYKSGDYPEPAEGFPTKPSQPIPSTTTTNLSFVNQSTTQITQEADYASSESDDDEYEDGSQIDTPGRTSPVPFENKSHYLSEDFEPVMYKPRG